ncbi:C-C chemokine receptor type 8-like [Kryptolebias marmoratus]|uniref:C-C chemokine receptor type 8-like n=1 Tax=Kryptolebias marmoratus TaxID=37003 RepID=UPI0007F8E631|nr:C-C chemokine receptor type 8-like [Kryptolebias marmoratus]
MAEPNSTVATSNSSSPGVQPHPSWDSSRLVPAVLFSLCFSVGVPGNIAVIILKPNWKHLSRLSQSLLLNLAVSDLLCLLTLPLWSYTFLYGWMFGLVSCKVLAGFLYCCVCSSMLTVTGLSIQRYLIVVHRLKCNQVQIRVMLVLLWLVAFILSIPSLVVRQLKTDGLWKDCQPVCFSKGQWIGVLLTETLYGIVLFFIVVFSYIHLKKKINQAAFFNNPWTNRLITSIIVSLFILWLPYFIINLLGITAHSLEHQGLLKFYDDNRRIAEAVTFVNSCLNPLLYAFTSNKMFFLCRMKKPMQVNQRTSQTPDNTTQELL